ncbi:MAG TPA: M20/M25/M40 family metallo-hydrolase, partial [Bryobacterales bacterium]|nr:M20/M25/M40 family metallo-hydrolase [Bryobacterales bacterium]
TYFQEFAFTAGVRLGKDNYLAHGDRAYTVGRDWQPVAFSATGRVEPAPIVFAGYGIVAPGENKEDAYDAYRKLDVRGKWVLVLRFLPEDLEGSARQKLSRYANLRYKAMVARDRGARGLIVVTGPRAAAKNRLVPLKLDGSPGSTSIPVISVSDDVAAAWFDEAGKSLEAVQQTLDTGKIVPGFALGKRPLACRIDLVKETRRGRNVLGILRAAAPAQEAIVIGAHVDHLGRGAGGSSLARPDEQGRIHYGADDNASGVAAMLEIAEYLAAQKASGRFAPKRDLVFAAWSGEELGLIGSRHFVQEYQVRRKPASSDSSIETGVRRKPAVATEKRIVACLNLDMVGRLREKLILQGVGSSPIWRSEIERRNAPLGLAVTIQEDGFIPTDGASFYTAGIPILSAFTGAHAEYHTPRDIPTTLNADGAAQVAKFMALVARGLALRDEAPTFVASKKRGPGRRSAMRRVYLGTIPAYGDESTKGVRLTGVAEKGPAQRAGLRSGDVIVELAGRKIENIYDYVYAMERLRVGKPAKVVVLRSGKRLELTITPGSRD